MSAKRRLRPSMAIALAGGALIRQMSRRLSPGCVPEMWCKAITATRSPSPALLGPEAVHNAGELMSAIVAKRPVEYLRAVGLRRHEEPPIVGERVIYALAQARRSDSPFGCSPLNRRNHSRSRGRCGFEHPQPLLVECENRRGEAEIQSDRAAARRHFALRLKEDVEHLLAGVLGGEILRVVA